MTKHDETQDDRVGRGERDGSEGPPRPGLVLVWSGGRPFAKPLALVGGALEIGREGTELGALDDPLISRRHPQVTREHGRFFVRDLGSRNGTAVDGQSVVGRESHEATQLVRTGGSIFLVCADIRPHLAGVQVTKERVTGHALRLVWESIARAAKQGGSLHVTGESGVGSAPRRASLAWEMI